MQQGMRDFGNALVVALVSIGLMLGALSISLVEFVPEATPTATNIIFASPAPLTATSTLIPTITPTLGAESPTPSLTSTPVNTAPPPASCQPPFGWNQIVIHAGETLDILAIRYGTNKDELIRANCLLSSSLVAGTILYVPPVVANTLVTCTQGAAGWINSYVVKPQETFYSIATNHYTTAGLLKSVNCRTSDLLYAGETIWVPNVATRTPYPTPLPGVTATQYPTEPLTQTALPFPTALPFTATIIPSETSIPATFTPIPISTQIPTLTPSITPFPK